MDDRLTRPPRYAERFLLWFLRDEFAEEVAGDLEEKFHLVRENHSAFRSAASYWYQVFRYLRPFALRHFRSNSMITTMYTHHIKLSYRNFTRHKGSFLINLIGLTVGIASAFLIFLWTDSERNVDQFHPLEDQLYQVYLNHEEDGGLRTGPDTQILLAETLKEKVPEVEVALPDTPADWFEGSFGLSSGEEVISSRGKFSGKSFFTLFNFPLLSGDPATVISQKQDIAISESLALQMFHTTDVLGKTIEWHLLQFGGEATVSGVFADIPDNSSMKFDFILPFQVFQDMMGNNVHWGNYNSYAYVRLQPGTDVDELNARLHNFVKDIVEWSNVSPLLYPYSKNYLYGKFENGHPASGGRITYVRLFTLIAIFLLVIGCINFMNLTTARATRRMKEIGVKKTMGARRMSLVGQYLTESILITLIALVLASLLVVLALPWFEQVTGRHLILDWNFRLVGGALGIALLTGLLAGSYPALYLSGFRTIEVLKGKLHTSLSELITRKGLVIFQFAISITMIVCVIVVYKQLEYIQTRNLGYNPDHLLKIALEGNSVDHLETFISELDKLPGVSEATASSHSFLTGGSSYTTDVHWPDQPPDQNIKFGVARVYYDLTPTMGMKIVEGRDFSPRFGHEDGNVLVNETAVQTMGMTDPVGSRINMWGVERTIVGVVKDFNFSSLHQLIEPMLFHFDTTKMQYLMVRLKPGDVRKSIAEIEDFYEIFNPEYTLDYQFMDQEYQALYVAEQRVSRLSGYFAALAIFISCLGLFGLAMFAAERRRKEFGIRKVLGAGSVHMVRLLSGDFTKMILCSILLAVPASYILAHNWLQDFAYRISLEWYFFALAALVALLIAWLTLSFQLVKIIRINPAETLKTE